MVKAPDFDFSRLSEAALAEDTMRRRRDVWAVNDRAFEALEIGFGAWAGCCFLAFVAGGLIFGEPSAAFLVAFPTGTLISFPWIVKWTNSLAAVSTYTREMKERTADLHRRQAARRAA